MKNTTIFTYLILAIAIISVDPWSILPLGNFIIYFTINISVIISIFVYKKKEGNRLKKTNYILFFYLIWTVIGIIRGVFIAENYWEWKALSNYSITLLLPLFLYIFIDPLIVQKTMRLWVKYELPLFVIFALFLIIPDAYGFYLGPIWLLGLFIPLLMKRWQIIFFFLLILLLTVEINNRSTVIKTAFVLFLLLLYNFRTVISIKTLKIIHISFFVIPIVLLYLGISGIFNIFEMDSYLTSKKNSNDLLLIDTRSFIYEDEINSAIKNNYVIWGRTPARGYDSEIGEQVVNKIIDSGNSKGVKIKFERTESEVVMLNVFNYLGIVGVILYSILYFQASYLAITKSNNFFLKMIGLYIAFRWLYGWVEDFNRFDIMNISLWMMIAMAYSPFFRKMNTKEITIWVRGIFKLKYKRKNYKLYTKNTELDQNENVKI